LLPTHVRGPETRQDPIRLKNLTGQARERLLEAGLSPAHADAVLAPAVALVDNVTFWRHQEQGLAIFLSGGEPHLYKLPVPVAEHLVVGPGFHVRPLLSLLAADGAFSVLTITADKVRLFHATRFAMTEDTSTGLPVSISQELGELDYENPVQASPIARPHTGSLDISNAQVYGDSPEDWRKGRLVEFTRRIAAAMDSRAAASPIPLVLIADAEIGGHFQKFSTGRPPLAGVVDVNPESMNSADLHQAAYKIVRASLDTDRFDALHRFHSMRGRGDARAASGIEDVVRAAHRGQVDTLLLAEDSFVWGRYDESVDQVITDPALAASGQDLLDTAAAQTLQNGGHIHLFAGDTLSDELVGAILRY
jgi:hypothetical protein